MRRDRDCGVNHAKKPNGNPPNRNWIGDEPFRPPWFRAEAPYTGRCDSCGLCIRACPRGILVAGFDGSPEVDFTLGGCDFCRACLGACSRGAFAAPNERPPWPYAAAITGGCLAFQGVACQLCEEFCKAGAISFRHFAGGFALAEIAGEACTGCGACITACPALAITMQADNGGKG